MSNQKHLAPWVIKFREESRRTLIRSVVHNDVVDVKKKIFSGYLFNSLIILGIGVGSYLAYYQDISKANAEVKVIEKSFNKKQEKFQKKENLEKKLPNLAYTAENGKKMPLIYNSKTNSIYFLNLKVELPAIAICNLLEKNSKYQNKQLEDKLACKS